MKRLICRLRDHDWRLVGIDEECWRCGETRAPGPAMTVTLPPLPPGATGWQIH